MPSNGCSADLSKYPVPRITFSSPSELLTPTLPHYFVGVLETKNAYDQYFYAGRVRGEVLYVVLHGAVRKGIDTYPRFDRIRSLRDAGVPFLSFADPALSLSPDLELAWYLGGSDWDPQSGIAALISEAVDAVGASMACIIGGSGGGFAALRLSRAIEGSTAFVFNPQTNIVNYIPRVRDQFLDLLYGRGGVSRTDPIESGDFNLADLYYSSPLKNRVYYLQSISDTSHLLKHYKPFKDRLGVTDAEGETSDGMVRFVLIDSVTVGHGPPSRSEFNYHLAQAVAWPVH